MSQSDRLGQTRLAAIDWLKCASILAVIVTHAGVAAFPGAPGYTNWDSVLRHLVPSFHVPCLLMISGFLYFRPHPIGWLEVRARLQRILVPYVLASLAVFALRPMDHPTVVQKVAALAIADALSIYYYIFLLALFVLMLPVISRLPVAALKAAVASLLIVLAIQSALSWRWSFDFHWAMRNPIESFTLGYFLLGWLAAARKPQSGVNVSDRAYAVTLASAIAWPVCIAGGSPYPAILLAKIPYSVAVWQSAWRFLDRKPAPHLVRLISDSTYGIFLYHFLAMAPFYGVTGGWPPLARIVALTAAGLSGSLLLGTIVRSVAGVQRTRAWFGF